MERDPDALIERDEGLFFEIIQTMPDDGEAIDLLERARQHVLREKVTIRRRNPKNYIVDSLELDRLLTRINDEIRRINRRLDDRRWYVIIETALGRDALELVKAYKRGMAE